MSEPKSTKEMIQLYNDWKKSFYTIALNDYLMRLINNAIDIISAASISQDKNSAQTSIGVGKGLGKLELIRELTTLDIEDLINAKMEDSHDN